MIYSILEVSELDAVDYSEVTQDSAETVRKNIAGTQFVISFFSESVPAIAKDSHKYTHTGILIFLNDPSNGWATED